MQKRISIEQLRPGMFVHDLDLDWLSHPFLRNRFLVKDEEALQKIRATGVAVVCIDTDLGADVAAPVATPAQPAAALQPALQPTPAPPRPRVSLQEELGRAQQVQQEAQRVVRGMMNDVRLGKQVQLDLVEPLVEKMTVSIVRNAGALLSLGQLKSFDGYTFEHSVSVCALMISFCRTLGLSPEATREAGLGALLHDVGKVKVPLEILNKPGRYTPEEFAVMQRHPGDGYEILRENPALGAVPLAIVLQHHERMDGTGYPHRRAGAEIDRYAQMAAIVDVYDAITSERCYHKGMSPGEAVRKLYEWSPHHFNPELVQAFVRSIGIYPVGALVRLESEKLAWVQDQHETQLLKPKVKVFYSIKSRGYITPFELDLSRNLGQGGGDKIVACENPATWGIDPAKTR